ncbi:MAG TPA: ATP-binding cassette domain-containing protein [Planctomycetota bacterium]|nr:ATP-binding cassette domain-containing protein [Planctomycetota bacterium]
MMQGGAGGPLLRIRSLAASEGGRQLFSGIDLDIEPGQLVALTGVNGSGKSTLLRTILGLRRADAGTVERAPRLKIGYVPQLDPADAGLPFPAQSIVRHGLPRFARRETVLAALRRAGFAAPPGRRYVNLSGGERRRVLLARAIACGPKLLALDEPTAGVDAEGTEEFLRIVTGEIRERGAGAVWVCHGLAAVESAAARIVRLGGAA